MLENDQNHFASRGVPARGENKMSEPFDFRNWFRRHPFTVLMLVATVIVNIIAGRYFYLCSILDSEIYWDALTFSQLSLLAWWVTSSKKEWMARLCWAFIAWVAMSVIRDSTYYYDQPKFVSGWFVVGMIGFSSAIRHLLTEGVSFPKDTLRFSLKHLFVVTTVVAIGVWSLRYRDQLPFLENPQTFIEAGDAFGGKIISGVALGLLAPTLFVRGISTWLLPILVGVASVFISVVVIFVGEYDYFPWETSYSRYNIPLFNAVQTLIFVTWFTTLRLEANWCERLLGPADK